MTLPMNQKLQIFHDFEKEGGRKEKEKKWNISSCTTSNLYSSGIQFYPYKISAKTKGT